MRPAVGVVLLTAAMACLPTGRVAAQPFDLLIRNGRIVNGTGNPWFYGDIGIVADEIRAVGDLSAQSARKIIDARSMVVTPGFIDVHTHVDDALGDAAPALLNYLSQGVTTVRPGADGDGTLRIAETKRDWENAGMGPNAVMLVGFNAVRREAMGDDQLRAPSPSELERMKALVRQAMTEGAWGISTGLEYEGYDVHVTTEELIEVTRPAAEAGGVYVSHMRDEAAEILDSVRELLRIGEETGAPVSITHLKVTGRDQWGLMRDVVDLVESARRQGLMVTADQYPFLQGAPTDFITALIDIPPDLDELAELRRSLADPELRGEEQERLRRRFVERLQAALGDPAFRERLRESTYERRVADPGPVARWGWQDFRIKVTELHPQLLEKTLAEIVEEQGRDGFDILGDLVTSEPLMLFSSASQSPDDMRHALQRRWVMVSSDGTAPPPGKQAAAPVPGHPRSFASQAIVLRKYVREEGLLTLEDAVRKMTSLPAQFLGLPDRGLLLPGYKADLAIFDPAKFRDEATYADARRLATGMSYVIVNGKLSIEKGRYDGALNGRVLSKGE